MSKLAKQGDELFISIGKQIYAQHQTGEELPENIRNLCLLVDDLSSQYAALEQQLQTLQINAETAPQATCPSCGEQTPAGQKFCHQCGAQLTSQ
jgi:rRNA maturation endonuclease Nob1